MHLYWSISCFALRCCHHATHAMSTPAHQWSIDYRYSLLLLCCSHLVCLNDVCGCCKCGSKTDVVLMPPLCHNLILLNTYLLTRMADLCFPSPAPSLAWRDSDNLDSRVKVRRPLSWHEETQMTWTRWSQSFHIFSHNSWLWTTCCSCLDSTECWYSTVHSQFTDAACSLYFPLRLLALQMDMVALILWWRPRQAIAAAGSWYHWAGGHFTLGLILVAKCSLCPPLSITAPFQHGLVSGHCCPNSTANVSSFLDRLLPQSSLSLRLL